MRPSVSIVLPTLLVTTGLILSLRVGATNASSAHADGEAGIFPSKGAAEAAPGTLEASEAVRRVVAALEPEVRRAMVDGRIPSVTLALTVGDETVWSGAWGETNLRTRTPATPESVYIIASTLKTMVATLVLQLVDEGLLGLDDPVREIGEGIRIPGEDPRRPVTVRHLLTHRSGLAGGFSSVPVWADTVPRNLDVFLAEGLRVLGPPDETVRYSNPGFAILARVVEAVTGEDFRDAMRARLWEPLGMGSTAFAPTPTMEEVLAVPYRPAQGGNGALEPVARTRFAEWPAGGAWGTVLDQAHWIRWAVRVGQDGVAPSLLSPASATEMFRRQADPPTGPMTGGWGSEDTGYGLAWWVSTVEGERYIAHSGSVAGYTAFLHGNRDRELGVALLTNGNRAHPHLVRLSFLATDLMAREGLGRDPHAGP